jgi:peptidyl-tRNA hydrolase
MSELIQNDVVLMRPTKYLCESCTIRDALIEIFKFNICNTLVLFLEIL